MSTCHAATYPACYRLSFTRSPSRLVDGAAGRVERDVSGNRIRSLGKTAKRPDSNGPSSSASARPLSNVHRSLRNAWRCWIAYLQSRAGRGPRSDTAAHRDFSRKHSRRATSYYDRRSARHTFASKGGHPDRVPHRHNCRDRRCEDVTQTAILCLNGTGLSSAKE